MVTSPDSRWIATASHDGTIIVWNAERGTIMQEWLAHCGGVNSLTFSPDSQRLVSAGGVKGETLVVWDFQIRAGNGVGRVAVLASIDTETRGRHCRYLFPVPRWHTDRIGIQKRSHTSLGRPQGSDIPAACAAPS